MVAAVLLDFSAAFDIVDHDILLAKLEGYGFNTLAVSWISSYLRDREQAVFINGDFSTYNKTKCGVPQGSCLGPLLFCLYTNDLATITEKANLVMYADDTTPFVAAPSVAEIKKVLQLELTRIWSWVETNRLVLNVGKTKSILIGSHHKLKQKPELNLSVAGKHITQVCQADLLGFTVDQHLSWGQHVRKIYRIPSRTNCDASCAAYLTSDASLAREHQTRWLGLGYMTGCVWNCECNSGYVRSILIILEKSSGIEAA
ncbi:hypothetical protein Bbelb_357240 [Branchiostoma belcheri]|nr:hypothetical protein Bbelb_357240 [Branchiostoma belcheri]